MAFIAEFVVPVIDAAFACRQGQVAVSCISPFRFPIQRFSTKRAGVGSASALAVLASLLLTCGLYFMKREAERLPSLDGGWRLTAWWAFVRDGWWLLGLGLQVVGYGLYLLALRSAPLSVISAALNGGVALFVVMSVVGLGDYPRPTEWLGVALITGSLILLGASSATATAVHDGGHAILPFSFVVAGLAALALTVDPHPRRPIGVSGASGLLLGLAAVYAKELAAGAQSTLSAATYVVLTLVTNLLGFALMQAALQSGRGVVVMPLFSALSNLVPIVGGFVVFGETLRDDQTATMLRPFAFVLTIVGAALLAGSTAQLVPQGTTDCAIVPEESG